MNENVRKVHYDNKTPTFILYLYTTEQRVDKGKHAPLKGKNRESWTEAFAGAVEHLQTKTKKKFKRIGDLLNFLEDQKKIL